MDPTLQLAFGSALYRIADSQAHWWLAPDCHCPQLSRLLALGGHACASLISAANPAAIRLSDEQNHRRQALLRQRVESLGVSFLEGENSAPDGSWREPSLLCLGMSLHVSLDLGREFDQVAILHSASDAVPRLWACWAAS